VHPPNVTHLDAISPVPGCTPPVPETVFHVVPPTVATIPPNTGIPEVSSLLKAPPAATLHPSGVATYLLDATSTDPTLQDAASTALLGAAPTFWDSSPLLLIVQLQIQSMHH